MATEQDQNKAAGRVVPKEKRTVDARVFEGAAVANKAANNNTNNQRTR